jgi:hypothetical protein
MMAIYGKRKMNFIYSAASPAWVTEVIAREHVLKDIIKATRSC